ncbi:hypothetical protein ACQP1P_30780 [Dactylosporangium sp. CA-052675]|uniref:hypothetical protein n=1 Tax=Dactylosporangium sp. CA-052675 TaxID=3239927 RepID=UPI003D8D0354
MAVPSASAAGRASAAAAVVSVRGRAWNDRNRDGIRQSGEPGIAGLPVAVFAVGELAGAARADVIKQLVDRVRARDTGGGDVRLAVTGRDGTYAVSGLPAGTVVVLMGAGRVDGNGNIPAVEWVFTRAGAGNDRGRDCDFVPFTDGGGPAVFGVSDVITIAGGGSVVLDAGLHRRPVLAVTGVGVAGVGWTGLALVCVGFVLVRAARRRA